MSNWSTGVCIEWIMFWSDSVSYHVKDETKAQYHVKLEVCRDTLETRDFRWSTIKTEYRKCKFSESKIGLVGSYKILGC